MLIRRAYPGVIAISDHFLLAIKASDSLFAITTTWISRKSAPIQLNFFRALKRILLMSSLKVALGDKGRGSLVNPVP